MPSRKAQNSERVVHLMHHADPTPRPPRPTTAKAKRPMIQPNQVTNLALELSSRDIDPVKFRANCELAFELLNEFLSRTNHEEIGLNDTESSEGSP
jgi:hypothetical protein